MDECSERVDIRVFRFIKMRVVELKGNIEEEIELTMRKRAIYFLEFRTMCNLLIRFGMLNCRQFATRPGNPEDKHAEATE